MNAHHELSLIEIFTKLAGFGSEWVMWLLLGLGGCSAFDVMLILKRGREAVTDCVVDIDAERATTDPKVFTKIVMHYTVTGRVLDPKKVERAVQLSAEKYCSASAIIGKTAEIAHTITLVNATSTTTGATA